MELLQQLRVEDRPATHEEQKILARWSGWGAVPKTFNEKETSHSSASYGWARARLRELLTEEEYAAARSNTLNAHYTDAALASAIWDGLQALGFAGGRVLEPGCGAGTFIGLAPEDTPIEIVGVEQEPVTAGIAAALYPDADIRHESFADSRFVSGSFDAVIGNVPFGRFRLRDPEHNPGRRFPIHTHFISKSLDLVKPGGLVALITSRWTMDGVDERAVAARQELATKADLVGAIRLPNGAHRRAAGTEVVTDLLILRRREPDRQPLDVAWTESVPIEIDGTEINVNQYFTENPDMVIGELAGNGPRGPADLTVRGPSDAAPALADLLGKVTTRANASGLGMGYGPRNDEELSLLISDKPEGYLEALPDGTFTQVVDKVAVPYEPSSTDRQELRSLLQMRDTVVALLTAEEASTEDTPEVVTLREKLNGLYDGYTARYGPINRFNVSPRIKDTQEGNQLRQELIAAGHARIVGGTFVLHNDVDVQALITNGFAELTDEGVVRMRRTKAANRRRQQLLDTGLAHVEGGSLKLTDEGRRIAAGASDEAVAKVKLRPAQGGFRSDPFAARVQMLEKFDPQTQSARKNQILRQRVLLPRAEPDRADNPSDALVICLDRYAEVRLDIIASLLGVPDEAAAREELGQLVFEEPAEGRLVPAAEYLSGDVRQKLVEATEAAAKNPDYRVNVEALTKVIPEDIGPADIEARLGAIFIDPTYVQQFLRETLADSSIKVVLQPDGRWDIPAGNHKGVLQTATWGTEAADALTLAERLLNQAPITIRVKDPQGGSHIDAEATEAAQDKAQELNDRFSSWVWEDLERAADITSRYNNTFNAIVLRSYDDVQLSLPGLNKDIKLNWWQKSAVARMIYEPAVGLFHDMGSGKTLEQIVGVMELKRLGLIKKPVICIKNHMLDQFRDEFLWAYPKANLLCADSEELTGEGRRRFIARCASENPDAIIMTRGAFESIPLSPDGHRAYINYATDLFQAHIAEQDLSVKEDETLLAEFIQRLRSYFEPEEEKEGEEEGESGKKKKNRKRKIEQDPALMWEHTGIDYICVDESQDFNNLWTPSNVESQEIGFTHRAVDLEMKIFNTRNRFGKRVVTFATGTPVTNKIIQFHVMQRYLRPDRLKKMGFHAPDSWLATFSEQETRLELKADNSYGPVNRCTRIINIPELLLDVHMFGDFKSADDIGLKRPKIVGGKVEVRGVPKTFELLDYQGSLPQRYKAAKRNRGKKGEDTVLAVIGDGFRAAQDLRLVKAKHGTIPHIPEEPQKIDYIADDVYAEWLKHRDDEYLDEDGNPDPVRGSLQLVFCNEGVPNSEDWNLYEELRDLLVAKGMPREAIRFIHETGSDARKKRDLFAACNAGHVAVLMGSTEKMGVGTNVQKRVIGIHKVHPHWRPDYDDQEDARGRRPGNQNPEIFIRKWITEGSFDVFKSQACERKSQFVKVMWRRDPSVRSFEMPDDDTVGYAEVSAVGADDVRIIEKAKLEAENKKLVRAQRSHARAQNGYLVSVQRARATVAAAEQTIIQVDQAVAQRLPTSGEAFRMHIGRTTYTSRTEAGDTLRALLRDSIATLPPGKVRHLPIGKLGGFSLVAEVVRDSRENTIRLDLEGVPGGQIFLDHRELPPGRGIVARLENRLADLEALREKLVEEIERQRLEEAHAQSAIGKPFAQLDHLTEVRKRLSQLKKELTEAQSGTGTTTSTAPGENKGPDSDAVEDLPASAPEKEPTAEPPANDSPGSVSEVPALPPATRAPALDMGSAAGLSQRSAPTTPSSTSSELVPPPDEARAQAEDKLPPVIDHTSAEAPLATKPEATATDESQVGGALTRESVPLPESGTALTKIADVKRRLRDVTQAGNALARTQGWRDYNTTNASALDQELKQLVEVLRDFEQAARAGSQFVDLVDRISALAVRIAEATGIGPIHNMARELDRVSRNSSADLHATLNSPRWLKLFPESQSPLNESAAEALEQPPAASAAPDQSVTSGSAAPESTADTTSGATSLPTNLADESSAAPAKAVEKEDPSLTMSQRWTEQARERLDHLLTLSNQENAEKLKELRQKDEGSLRNSWNKNWLSDASDEEVAKLWVVAASWAMGGDPNAERTAEACREVLNGRGDFGLEPVVTQNMRIAETLLQEHPNGVYPSHGPWSGRIKINADLIFPTVTGTNPRRDPPELRKLLKQQRFEWRPPRKLWEYSGARGNREAAVLAIREYLAQLDQEAIASEAKNAEKKTTRHPPTPQQQAIINHVVGGGDLRVLALAGTGKTTTMLAVADALRDRKITYIAFNSSIRDEAKQKFDSSVNVVTSHGLAYQSLKAEGTYAKKLRLVGKGATAEADIVRILGIEDFTFPVGRQRMTHRAGELGRWAMATVKAFRESASTQIGKEHLPEGLASRPRVADRVLVYANAAWENIVDPSNSDRLVPKSDRDRAEAIRFSHDDYLKIFALGRPRIDADLIIFDEAQDINPVTADLIQRQTAQTVVVGDSYQSIYGFRGAVDAISTWPAPALPITQSFRFGPRVAEAGNMFLRLLKADLVLEGNPALDTQIVSPDNRPRTDAILCRTNFGAVNAIDAAQSAGRRVALVGGKNELVDFAKAAQALMNGRRTRHQDFAQFESWQDVLTYVREHPEEKGLTTFVNLIERKSAEGLLRLLDDVVDENAPDPTNDPKLIVSTAHKAKGREWDHVVIADDFKGPKTVTDDDGNDQIILPDPEELRLNYVTVTRAQKSLDLGSLGWISTFPFEEHEQSTPAPPVDRNINAVQAAEATQPVQASHLEPAPAPEPAPGAGFPVLVIEHHDKATIVHNVYADAQLHKWLMNGGFDAVPGDPARWTQPSRYKPFTRGRKVNVLRRLLENNGRPVAPTVDHPIDPEELARLVSPPAAEPKVEAELRTPNGLRYQIFERTGKDFAMPPTPVPGALTMSADELFGQLISVEGTPRLEQGHLTVWSVAGELGFTAIALTKEDSLSAELTPEARVPGNASSYFDQTMEQGTRTLLDQAMTDVFLRMRAAQDRGLRDFTHVVVGRWLAQQLQDKSLLGGQFRIRTRSRFQDHTRVRDLIAYRVYESVRLEGALIGESPEVSADHLDEDTQDMDMRALLAADINFDSMHSANRPPSILITDQSGETKVLTLDKAVVRYIVSSAAEEESAQTSLFNTTPGAEEESAQTSLFNTTPESEEPQPLGATPDAPASRTPKEEAVPKRPGKPHLVLPKKAVVTRSWDLGTFSGDGSHLGYRHVAEDSDGQEYAFNLKDRLYPVGAQLRLLRGQEKYQTQRQGMPGATTIHISRPVVSDADPLTNADIARALGVFWSIDLAELIGMSRGAKAPGTHLFSGKAIGAMFITTSKRGVEISATDNGQRREGTLTWKQAADWLRAGMHPDMVRVFQQAARGSRRFVRNEAAFGVIGEAELEKRARKEIESIANDLKAKVVKRALAWHEKEATGNFDEITEETRRSGQRVTELLSVFPPAGESDLHKPARDLSVGDIIESPKILQVIEVEETDGMIHVTGRRPLDESAEPEKYSFSPSSTQFLVALPRSLKGVLGVEEEPKSALLEMSQEERNNLYHRDYLAGRPPRSAEAEAVYAALAEADAEALEQLQELERDDDVPSSEPPTLLGKDDAAPLEELRAALQEIAEREPELVLPESASSAEKVEPESLELPLATPLDPSVTASSAGHEPGDLDDAVAELSRTPYWWEDGSQTVFEDIYSIPPASPLRPWKAGVSAVETECAPDGLTELEPVFRNVAEAGSWVDETPQWKHITSVWQATSAFFSAVRSSAGRYWDELRKDVRARGVLSVLAARAARSISTAAGSLGRLLDRAGQRETKIWRVLRDLRLRAADFADQAMGYIPAGGTLRSLQGIRSTLLDLRERLTRDGSGARPLPTLGISSINQKVTEVSSNIGDLSSHPAWQTMIGLWRQTFSTMTAAADAGKAFAADATTHGMTQAVWMRVCEVVSDTSTTLIRTGDADTLRYNLLRALRHAAETSLAHARGELAPDQRLPLGVFESPDFLAPKPEPVTKAEFIPSPEGAPEPERPAPRPPTHLPTDRKVAGRPIKPIEDLSEARAATGFLREVDPQKLLRTPSSPAVRSRPTNPDLSLNESAER